MLRLIAHFRRTYSDADRENDIRLGFERSNAPPFENYKQKPAVDESPFAIDDEDEDEASGSQSQGSDEKGESKQKNDSRDDSESARRDVNYGSMDEERRAWGADGNRDS